ncbi:unnamed protein product [Pylaiella littoralis]
MAQQMAISVLPQCFGGCQWYITTGGLGRSRQHLLGPGQLTWKGNLVSGQQRSRSHYLPVSYLPDFVEDYNKNDTSKEKQ